MNGEKLESLGVEIKGFGHYLPRKKVENDEIMSSITLKASSVDTAVLGDIAVKSRYWADEDETIAYMAKCASEMALKSSGISAKDVDLLVLSNWTSRQFVPDIAPQVASLLGADKALSFDVCCACCGFINAVMTATSYLNTDPRMKTAIVVSSEQFSKGVRPHSKGQLITGDAAGAIILMRTGNKKNGVIDFNLKSDGNLKSLVGVKMPECWVRSKPELAKLGPIKNVEVAAEILDRNEITIEDIDWYVPHPGTDTVNNGIKAGLNIPDEKFITNFDRVANTSSASIPLVLSENYHSGKFKKDDVIMMSGIGSGLYYGALLIRI